MTGPLDPNDRSRFDAFTIHTTPYKTVHDHHQITADVVYPTSLLSDTQAQSTPRPVVIRFHGGGLVTGSSLFPGFFGKWLLELAQRHNAIIVSFDYQLFPEASPKDMLSDITDAWTWVNSSLEAYLSGETGGAVSVDRSRIITSGESAGGLLSLLLGLEVPRSLRAVLSQYPMADLKSPHFTQDYNKRFFGMPPENFPASLYTELMEGGVELERRTGLRPVVSSDPVLARLPSMFSAFLHGTLKNSIEGRDGGADMYVFDRMRRGQKFPRGGLFVWHGDADSVVPVEGSHNLQKVVQETDPELNFKLAIQPGDHGFDSETKLQDEWIKGIIEEVEKVWLS